MKKITTLCYLFLLAILYSSCKKDHVVLPDDHNTNKSSLAVSLFSDAYWSDTVATGDQFAHLATFTLTGKDIVKEATFSFGDSFTLDMLSDLRLFDGKSYYNGTLSVKDKKITFKDIDDLDVEGLMSLYLMGDMDTNPNHVGKSFQVTFVSFVGNNGKTNIVNCKAKPVTIVFPGLPDGCILHEGFSPRTGMPCSLSTLMWVQADKSSRSIHSTNTGDAAAVAEFMFSQLKTADTVKSITLRLIGTVEVNDVKNIAVGYYPRVVVEHLSIFGTAVFSNLKISVPNGSYFQTLVSSDIDSKVKGKAIGFAVIGFTTVKNVYRPIYIESPIVPIN